MPFLFVFSKTFGKPMYNLSISILSRSPKWVQEKYFSGGSIKAFLEIIQEFNG
jgi:hypothetical protein